MGKVWMVAMKFETGGCVVKNRMAAQWVEPGRFVLWQMAMEMWYIELASVGARCMSATMASLCGATPLAVVPGGGGGRVRKKKERRGRRKKRRLNRYRDNGATSLVGALLYCKT
jgi:hypothetical protein